MPKRFKFLLPGSKKPKSRLVEAKRVGFRLPKPKKPTPRLNSSQMFEYAFKIAVSAGDYTATPISTVPSIPFFNNEENSKYRPVKFSVSQPENPKEVILLHPTADSDRMTKDCAGTVPLYHSLDFVKTYQQNAKGKDSLFIIPLSESRPYRGAWILSWVGSCLSFLTRGYLSIEPKVRQHWTLLTIKGNQCCFYDPKSISSGQLYSLDYVKDALRTRDFNCTVNYVGLQHWRDDTHCGYFTGSMIKREIDNHISDRQTEVLTKSVDETYNDYQIIKSKTFANLKYQRFMSPLPYSTPATVLLSLASDSDGEFTIIEDQKLTQTSDLPGECKQENRKDEFPMFSTSGLGSRVTNQEITLPRTTGSRIAAVHVNSLSPT